MTDPTQILSDDNKGVLLKNFDTLGSDAYKFVVEQGKGTLDPPPDANAPVAGAGLAAGR